MRRVVATVLGAALACMATGRAAEAQSGWLRRDSRFDLAAYVGGTYSTRWFTLQTPAGAEQGYSPGYGPAFGVAASWWATPSLGLRVHAAYAVTDLPDSDAGVVRNGSFGANHYFYDLELALRPWISRPGVHDWAASTYLFAGGGGLTTNAAGSGGCASEYPAASGVCLPRDAAAASVGQGVVGAGMDMYPLYRSVTLFGEAALHGYRSPARVSAGSGARDLFAFTPRIVGGVRFFLGGTARAQRPVIRKPPEALPRPVPQDTARGPELEPPAASGRGAAEVLVCVVRQGALEQVPALVDPATGDTTTADGRRFAEAYPATAGYAGEQPWFAAGEAVEHGGAVYEKVGLPRTMPPGGVRRAGEFRGVSVFAEPDADARPAMVYLPTRRGCEFQPYQLRELLRRVRG